MLGFNHAFNFKPCFLSHHAGAVCHRGWGQFMKGVKWCDGLYGLHLSMDWDLHLVSPYSAHTEPHIPKLLAYLQSPRASTNPAIPCEAAQGCLLSRLARERGVEILQGLDLPKPARAILLVASCDKQHTKFIYMYLICICLYVKIQLLMTTLIYTCIYT